MVMMNKIVLANWKANLSPDMALKWCDQFVTAYSPIKGLDIVLAVPYLYLERVHRKIDGVKGVSLAAQCLSPFPPGGYTGAIPAVWLKGLVRYALAGHQERRRYFRETVQDVANQAAECLAVGIQPIICLDRSDFGAQIAACPTEDLEQIIWAYTPSDAVQLERSHATDDISTSISQLRIKTGSRQVLYGGGVGLENSKEILALPGISGIMLGRECLDAGAFVRLVQQL